MFEFKFDNQENYKGIEKDIQNYNKKDNIPFISKVGVCSVFGATLGALATTLNTSGINPAISIATGVVAGTVLSGTLFELVTKMVNISKRNKAKNNLELIVNGCEKNDVKTNTDNLSESIIIKQSNKEMKEVIDEGEVNSRESIINDNYYLFLNENEELCGILERQTINKNNNETFDNTCYYILEDTDIEPLEKRITPVKKLIRKPKDN